MHINSCSYFCSMTGISEGLTQSDGGMPRQSDRIGSECHIYIYNTILTILLY